MLKLIIADDERIIRESISRIIDWSSLGIELIGVCQAVSYTHLTLPTIA